MEAFSVVVSSLDEPCCISESPGDVVLSVVWGLQMEVEPIKWFYCVAAAMGIGFYGFYVVNFNVISIPGSTLCELGGDINLFNESICIRESRCRYQNN